MSFEFPGWAKQTVIVVTGTIAVLAWLNSIYAEKRELAALEKANQLRAIRAELRTTRSDRNNLEARLKENVEAQYFWEHEAPQDNPTRTEFLKDKIEEQKTELEKIDAAVLELEDELIGDG